MNSSKEVDAQLYERNKTAGVSAAHSPAVKSPPKSSTHTFSTLISSRSMYVLTNTYSMMFKPLQSC